MLPFTNRMPLCDRDRAQVVTQKVKGESPAGRSGFLCLHFYSCCLLTSGSLSGCCGDGCLPAEKVVIRVHS